MKTYSGFAQVYDFLMNDFDYDSWVEYIEDVLSSELIKSPKILDLACGTGNITNRLAQKGYKLTGVDISPDMLTLAQDKAQKLGVKVKYLNQDISDLKINDKFDSVLCMCDGINYITDKSKLMGVFQNIYSSLEDRGIFIFDISSFYKISEILGNNTYAENYEDVSYIWENYFDEDSNICEFDLTIFIRKEELFARYQETHKQRAYKSEELYKLLMEIGYREVGIYDNYTCNKENSLSERINFICKK